MSASGRDAGIPPATGPGGSPARPTATVAPCTCRGRKSDTGPRSIASATSRHALSSAVEPSNQRRDVNMCGATRSSGRQMRTGPRGACTHAKGSVGWGSVSNIIGLGLDATDIDRVADVIERHGERFLNRVFTDGEIAYCMRRRVPAIHFAGRFAAKEAGMKALGTGHALGVVWRDVEVVRRGGPPQLLP